MLDNPMRIGGGAQGAPAVGFDAHAFLRSFLPRTLTLREVCLLGAVVDQPGVGVKEMAALMRVSKPTISRATDRLAKDKLLKRKQSAVDRRAVEITATLSGIKLWSAALEAAGRAK